MLRCSRHICCVVQIDENDFLMAIKNQANISNATEGASGSDDEGTEGGSIGQTSYREKASQKASPSYWHTPCSCISIVYRHRHSAV